MTFDDLTKKAIVKDNMAWCYLAWGTNSTLHASVYGEAEADFNSAVNTFLQDNPSHPIAKKIPFKTPEALQAENDLNGAIKILYCEYSRLKKDKLPPTPMYFDLFDVVVSLTKQYMTLVGIEHSELHHLQGDGALGTSTQIMNVVESMVEVVLDFKHDTATPDIPEKSPISSSEFIWEFMNAYPQVHVTVSERSGSFAINADPKNMRVHIKNRGSLDANAVSIAHEYGHALYQTEYLSKTAMGKIGMYQSLSLHESASIFSELLLAGGDTIVRENDNKNLFRIGSDKAHYVLHIYLRMVIEKELFENKITARDIPGRWNFLMSQYIGSTVENDWEGFLQDQHWNQGCFGYFHSYAIGLLTATTMLHALPFDIDHLDGSWNNAVNLMNDYILPTIGNTFGNVSEDDTNLLEMLHPDIDESIHTFSLFLDTLYTLA